MPRDVLRLDLATSHALDSLFLKSETYYSKFKSVSSFERNFSFKSFKGPQTEWPKTNSKGLKPRDSCTDSLTANSNKWMPSSQSFSVSKQYDLIILFKCLVKSF